MTDESRPARTTAGVLIGTAIVLLGVTLLLGRAGVILHLHYNVFWGAIVLAVGLVKLSHPPEHGRRHGGWWVFFGAWMLLNETRVWRAHESWPLLLVAAGVSIVWKELASRPGRRETVE
jgi:hypothetical protein